MDDIMNDSPYAGHTPGPWRWIMIDEHTPQLEGAIEYADMNPVMMLQAFDCGCGVRKEDGLCPLHPSKADKALIADAPALLAEVEKLLQEIRRREEDRMGRESLEVSMRQDMGRLRRQRDALLSALREYGQHQSGCIAGQWRQGRPTMDGGYETLFGYGKDARWYPKGEWPECTCGLDQAIEEASDD